MSTHPVRSLTPEEAEKIQSAVAGAVDETLTPADRLRMAKSRVALIREELAQAKIDLARLERTLPSPTAEDDPRASRTGWQERADGPIFHIVGCEYAVEDETFHQAHYYAVEKNTYRCLGVYR